MLSILPPLGREEGALPGDKVKTGCLPGSLQLPQNNLLLGGPKHLGREEGAPSNTLPRSPPSSIKAWACPSPVPGHYGEMEEG